MPVKVNCDSDQYGWLSVTVAQGTGHRLAQGSGMTSFTCDGSDQTVAVPVGNFPAVNAYKKGKASASGTVTVWDPYTWLTSTTSAGPQEIQIIK